LTSTKDFFGTLDEAKIQIPEVLEMRTNIPTILYMEGSKPFANGDLFRRWVVESDCIFFAPDSYASPDRLTYVSPVSKDIYEQVHSYRQAEISQFVSRVDELPIINQDNMFLMGNSEGALAAARYSGREFIARIVLGYSCEPGYYTDFPEIGADFENDAFLNIIGADDFYFGSKNIWNSEYDNIGNATNALEGFKNAKVVVLPNTGHDLTKNQFTKPEIISFIEMFKKRRGIILLQKL